MNSPKKYRKRPVVIEAMQYSAATCADICRWMDAEHRPDDECGVGPLYIPTLEGMMEASPGDFIVRGVKGEFYPCKPDIFALTNEEDGPVTLSASIREAAAKALHDAMPLTLSLGDAGFAVDKVAPVLAEGLLREVEEAQDSLALYSRAMERGRALYHERHPDRRDVWPDAGEQWYDLLDQLAALRQERDDAKERYALLELTKSRDIEAMSKVVAERYEAQLAAAKERLNDVEQFRQDLIAEEPMFLDNIAGGREREWRQRVIARLSEGRPGGATSRWNRRSPTPEAE